LNTIQWQDGSSNPVITVNSEGWYWVVVSNNCGEASDSVFVATAQSPEPFDLGEDQTLCPGDQVILSAPVLAPESTLTWSTGSQAPEITVAAAGEYALTITNLCGSVTDLVSIAIDPNQIALPSVTSFVLCEGESVVAD